MNLNLFRSKTTAWLFIILFPPLGIVLLWMNCDSRLLTRLAGSLAAILIGVAHLVIFWNLHIEMAGSMMRPIFSFRNANKHHEEIEKLRLAEHSIDASQIQAARPAPVQAVPTESISVDFKKRWSGREDSNLRPCGPEPHALPNCATPRPRTQILA
jgi:hypothetical protein